MNRYPLWRYILIIVMVVIGIIYALPSLFGEDNAIQISPKSSTATLPTDLVDKINQGLKAQNIKFTSIKKQPKTYSILIRFPDTEEQLKAQDVLQAVLGPDYTVVLNLAPNTPEWLRALGARPLRLGLDLRGGVHFLLAVDVSAVSREHEQGDIHSMGQQLRGAMIRYAGISATGKHGILVRFRDSNDRNQAQTLLKKNFPNYTFTTTQQNSNYLLEATMSPEELIKLEQYAVKQNITTLSNRINDLGVAEPVIQQQGKDKISVDLPGIQDMARAKAMIGSVATIRLQLVDTENNAMAAASSGAVPFGDTLYKFEGQPYLLKNQVVLTGRAITHAASIIGDDGRPAVSIRASGPEVTLFNKITGENVGKPLATVYVETKSYKEIVDGKVVTKHRQIEKIINIATIQTALGNSFQVTGLDSMRYAQNLALQLRSGAYSAPVDFVSESLLGPTLGQENIRMGVLSVEIAALVVIIFMALYYSLFGLVADVALILNVILLVAIMSILGATMTLPGIAGIVLTMGMAVDANVLINERIREELRNGISPQAAIHIGYERAFSTIVDANVTTLIVAAVLFALGTGPVQGFAVTLTIGLLISMITSIFFTRAMINLIYGRRSVKWLSIGIKKKTNSPPVNENQKFGVS